MDIIEYNRKITDYGNGKVEIVAYHKPQQRLIGMSHRGGLNEKSEISDQAQLERTKKQIYDIKRRIKGYALANDFMWFGTLTINPKKGDRFNYDVAKSMLLKWCRWMRDRYGKFEYLIVPELHKSGAVHFHSLLGDIPAQFNEAKNPKTDKLLIRNGRQIYNLKDWKNGFSDCEKIVDPDRTASYITKYITKDLMNSKEMFAKKRYFNSQGLKKPKVKLELTDNSDLKNFTPNFGVVDIDEYGKNYVDKGIYRLSHDKQGDFYQDDKNYIFKSKNKKVSD
ncbi:rolling circle replication-associated protein [Pediococcus acidilactici]|uniref:rolling circle replication-associated protein n=1 Tax=Pediococcus acidilactici TaxID=1254 RepID=UPI00137C0401|nr:hypothetical protein [Pediococcus acidilactici]QHS02487.1 hypothetical protein GWA24_01465 [Pediococcus acidilactici]